MPRKKQRKPTDAAPDTGAMLATLKQRASKEATQFDLATDSEFWFAVSFETREQKEHFLRELNWDPLGLKYIDGVDLASVLDIALPPRPSAMRTANKTPDRTLMELSEGDHGQ